MSCEKVYYVTYDLIYRVKPEVRFKIAKLVFESELEELTHSLNIKDLTVKEVEA